MIDRWFSMIKLRMTLQQFEKLPRNAAYKYEYFDGETWLTPRPKQYHAMLELRPAEAPTRFDVQHESIHLRPLVEADWEHLPPVFARSFTRVQPFASLNDKTALKAAQHCLGQTQNGGDGPLISPACLVAEGQGEKPLVGAILVTLMADVDLTDFTDLRWREPPPPDWLERNLGRPHLTWIFVHHLYAGHGVGTALLGAATNALLAVGYDRLATTFLLGNESSMLWHWRNGFQLLAYPASHRRLRERYTALKDSSEQGNDP
jgi:GNAT superfamily N-acetyltransferase